MNTFVPAPIKPTATIADLNKLDIRVGTIDAVEFVAGSDRLVKLTVEFGDRRRSVLAGLRNERRDPKAQLEGRQALFVVNLAVRKMVGQISEACSSTSGTRMASPRSWRSRSSRYRMGYEQVEGRPRLPQQELFET